MKKWGWMVQFGVTMVLALGLGALLSQVPLFQETTLGSPKVRASQGVQFISYGGALVILWRFGHRLNVELPTLWPKMKFLQPMILPLTTLMVVTAAHPVCGQILNPFLGKTGKGIYNWLFIIGMITGALWVVVSWYAKAAPLLQQEERKSGELDSDPSVAPVLSAKSS